MRERRGLHHHVPVEQQIIEIQRVVLLLAADILAVQTGQIRFPLANPGKLLLDRLFERQPRIDPVTVNGKTGVLAREALVLSRKAEIVTDDIHEVGRIGAVEHREIRTQPQMLGE